MPEPLGHHLAKDRGSRAYVCRRRPAGCAGISVRAEPLEQWILAECDRRGSTPQTSGADALEHARRLRELARDYCSARTISRDEFLAARAALAGDEPVSYTDRPRAGDVGAAGLYVSNRVARVVVRPGCVGSPFDPSRIEVAGQAEPTRPLIKTTRPGRGAKRLDADEWLTGEEARHVLCDMNIDAFHALVRAGQLRAAHEGSSLSP